MKEIIGYIKEVTYGKVQISVPDDATDEEIRDAVLERDSAVGSDAQKVQRNQERKAYG